MKRLTALMVSLFICATMFAQENTLKFLGIPVDGSKQDFITALKGKGFTYNSYYGYYEGRFNGMDVRVGVADNNGKVNRVFVQDKHMCNEAQIIIAFNRLLKQFENNGKYIGSEKNATLPDTEDVSYEMTVHNKQYEAGFYLKDNLDGVVWFTILEQYGSYCLGIYYDNLANHPHGEDL